MLSESAKMNLLYGAFIGAALGNCLPQPMDFFYFKHQREWRREMQHGVITPKQYWLYEAGAYYTYATAWYILVGYIIYKIDGGAEKKLKAAFAIVGAGVVLGILARNIKRDSDEQKQLVEKDGYMCYLKKTEEEIAKT